MATSGVKKPKSNCPRWPRCPCIVRGFVNHREPGGCGRKPKLKQTRPAYRHPVDRILDRW